MTAVLLRPPERHWVCPTCPATHVTRQAGPHTPFHPCAGMRGLSVPYVAEGVRAGRVAVERGDYIGADAVQLDDDGRPVMAVLTVRDEGQDCTVYAPCATGTSER